VKHLAERDAAQGRVDESFKDAWFVSPKYSQVALPKAATAADP
jgi:hypothetical protein